MIDEGKAQGHDDAVKSLRRAAEIKPDYAQAHRSLGVELSKLEDLDAAEASHRRALAIEPESETRSGETNCSLSFDPARPLGDRSIAIWP